MPTLPHLFDRNLLAKRLTRVVRAQQDVDFLKVRVAEDMAQTLGAINRQFARAIDLTARGGVVAGILKEELAQDKISDLEQADLIGCDQVIDLEALGLAPDQYELMLTALGLHWVNDLPGTLVQIRQALKPDGLFIGAMFGGETLTELRQSLMAAEIEVRGGYGPRIAPFVEGADMIDLMKRAGFAMPVVDHDRVKVTYDNPIKLMHDLRAMGESNILVDRPRTGLNKAILAKLFAHYFEHFTDDEGRIVATFEIITLSGWKPHESQQKPLRPGSAKMRLSDALGVSEGKL